ncbi:MAG: hypothetical protein LUQ65_01620 [Candidatus Helarchaeota archaeon]|nr:hypothetical protein [Candidatus Helarchaeota archaeon]
MGRVYSQRRSRLPDSKQGFRFFKHGYPLDSACRVDRPLKMWHKQIAVCASDRFPCWPYLSAPQESKTGPALPIQFLAYRSFTMPNYF